MIRCFGIGLVKSEHKPIVFLLRGDMGALLKVVPALPNTLSQHDFLSFLPPWPKSLCFWILCLSLLSLSLTLWALTFLTTALALCASCHYCSDPLWRVGVLWRPAAIETRKGKGVKHRKPLEREMCFSRDGTQLPGGGLVFGAEKRARQEKWKYSGPELLRGWLIGLAVLKGGLRTRLYNLHADGSSGKSSKSPTDHGTIDETDKIPGSHCCTSTPNSKT